MFSLRKTLRSVEKVVKAPASAVYRQIYGLLEGEPQSAIFVLGHMRSGSTLLNLILLTNPAITGCGERNRINSTPLDLDWLALNARWMHKSFYRRYRYVVDQINHSHFTPETQLFNDPRLRIVFLIREPVATISSIIRLSAEFYQVWPQQRAVDYYVERLTALSRYAHAIHERSKALVLTYDDLIERSEHTLQRLQKFLALDVGFSEVYKLQKFTGVRGDPTVLIKKGQIVRDPHRVALPIDADLLAQAWTAYSTCEQALRKFN